MKGDQQMRLVQSTIKENREIAPGYFSLKLNAPSIAEEAKPGQFIQIRTTDDLSADPLLARPISIFRIDPKEGSITALFKIIGRGTRLLALKQEGAALTIWGPLGNGFNIPKEVDNVALIAGGVGMPPLFCLNEKLKQADNPPQITLFYGGRTAADILEMELWEGGQTGIMLATEDGSIGFKGFVTELFIKEHQKNNYDFVVACGPGPMLAKVQKIAKMFELSGELSLESHMACGVGACLGCVCGTERGLQRVCIDGPVFPINEVIF